MRAQRFDPAFELAGRCQPGRAVDRAVLCSEARLNAGDACGQETEGLDDHAHGFAQLLGIGITGACAAAQQAIEPTPRGFGATRREGVVQRRRSRVVRPVAVTEVRERGGKIPLVTSLGRETAERLVQRLRCTGLGLVAQFGDGLFGLRFTGIGAVRRWLCGGHGG